MKRSIHLALATTIVLVAGALSAGPQAQQSAMKFFITSTGSGNGGNLGGLEGADALCQRLAKAAGATAKTWRAYLSTTGAKSVNARDRIGRGPWQNAKGEVIARTLDDLHSDKNNLNKQTALTETGRIVNGRGDKPNMHDILTGSSAEGRTVAGEKDTTCNNWTSSDAGSAIVGHHDRQGLDTSPPMLSWNSSHPSKGCSQQALVSTGGAGLIYCFAAD
ncbi:MAG: hypothetical protein IT536_06885 [Hyphomicrobiales bacterium]|nr:hypothetical protein [Hyphomicrobiales bacterium]